MKLVPGSVPKTQPLQPPPAFIKPDLSANVNSTPDQIQQGPAAATTPQNNSNSVAPNQTQTQAAEPLVSSASAAAVPQSHTIFILIMFFVALGSLIIWGAIRHKKAKIEKN
jgi:FtsZ-interacting cell division protein ZipA